MLDFTWRLSDCEELLGGYSKDDGVGFRGVIVLLHSQFFLLCFRFCRIL